MTKKQSKENLHINMSGNALEDMVNMDFELVYGRLDLIAKELDETNRQNLNDMKFYIKELREKTNELRHVRVVEMIKICLDICPQLREKMQEVVNKNATKKKAG